MTQYNYHHHHQVVAIDVMVRNFLRLTAGGVAAQRPPLELKERTCYGPYKEQRILNDEENIHLEVRGGRMV